ncbi:MAG: exodeoxyribonuclease VII large subunit [Ferruginibacter sp.]|nr:exodeoxyribonuclease VII large subunit [Rhodoferax sp.]
MADPQNPASAPQIWPVGALCRAIADTLEARFNPVAVRGEISGFSRASSGHCYFNLKDGQGQIRCAMFRRAASLLDFAPRDGELVEVRGRLGVYEPRGDLQLIVESMGRAGQGALFEQFLRLKAQLQAEGLFDTASKRPLPLLPRGIGVVTSLGAAALHDVVAALQRRVPHIPVVLAPALVQGAAAPGELVKALLNLYQYAQDQYAPEADSMPENGIHIDLILLVRGGGSLEDLWGFNDEQLARTIRRSPVPIVSGVGHETDFTIADFVADVRAPTPTAAAELAAQPRDVWMGALGLTGQRLQDAATRQLDTQAQRLDSAAQRLGRPSGLVARQQWKLGQQAQRLRYAALSNIERKKSSHRSAEVVFPQKFKTAMEQQYARLERAGRNLALLDPLLVLQRGYALLRTADGTPLTSVVQTGPGQLATAVLVDGEVALHVLQTRGN